MTEEAAKLKSKIATLQTAYVVLFGASLLLLVGRFAANLPPITQLFWALSLGGAVVVRIYRTSLVNKYNAMIRTDGTPGPLA